jgi:hypothetical protein
MEEAWRVPAATRFDHLITSTSTILEKSLQTSGDPHKSGQRRVWSDLAPVHSCTSSAFSGSTATHVPRITASREVAGFLHCFLSANADVEMNRFLSIFSSTLLNMLLARACGLRDHIHPGDHLLLWNIFHASSMLTHLT